jgi:hypothetical protein
MEQTEKTALVLHLWKDCKIETPHRIICFLSIKIQ